MSRPINAEFAFACLLGDMIAVRQLLGQGADVNSSIPRNWIVSNIMVDKSAIYCAASNNHISIVKLLITFPEINMQSLNNSDLLEHLCEKNHLEMLTLLITFPEIRMELLNTSDILVRESNNLALMKILLSLDVLDVNKKSLYTGTTGLMLASENLNLEVIKLFVTHPKICLGVKNKEGKTALDIAREMQEGKMRADFLRSEGMTDMIARKEKHHKIVSLLERLQKASGVWDLVSDIWYLVSGATNEESLEDLDRRLDDLIILEMRQEREMEGLAERNRRKREELEKEDRRKREELEKEDRRKREELEKEELALALKHSRLSEEMESLRTKIQLLKNAGKEEKIPSEDPSNPPAPQEKVVVIPQAPECPVCLERMTPPLKIFHCTNGHHVCSACKPKLKRCHCSGAITGRAIDMEKFVRENGLQ